MEEKKIGFASLSSSSSSGSGGLQNFQNLLNEFQLELILAHREFCKRGLRKIVQKKVDRRGPRGGHTYQLFDGEKWVARSIRMNARQLKEQRKGILGGCVENCQASI